MEKNYQEVLTKNFLAPKIIRPITTKLEVKAKVGQVSVVAFIVLGSDGSSSLDGTSTALSTPADRRVFLKSRRAFDCILIGGKTARSDSYLRTPVPLVIVSHSRPSVLDQNPHAHWWNCSPGEALLRAQTEFGPRIAIEGGISFLTNLLEKGLVDELRLSITPRSGGENKINSAQLLDQFQDISVTKLDDTIFYICSAPKVRIQK